MKKIRLSIDMPPALKEKFDALQARMGAATSIEVIRKAIALLDLITTEEKNGAVILIQTNTKMERLKLL